MILHYPSRFSNLTSLDRAVILGASRGFGAALVRHICSQRFPVTGFGRKEAPLAALKEENPLFDFRVADFSQRAGQDETLRYLAQENFNKVIYVAGGGPYGPFQEQSWKSHLWSFEVTFQFAARVTHLLLSERAQTQMILIGSSVAESLGDPQAASYCAAKHAINGFTDSLRGELIHDGSDVQITSVHMPAMNTTQFNWVKNRLPNNPQPVPMPFSFSVSNTSYAAVGQLVAALQQSIRPIQIDTLGLSGAASNMALCAS